MDWEGLSAVDVFQLERNEALLDSLYEFLEKNQLTAAEAARAEAGRLAKILSVTQCIMKVEIIYLRLSLYIKLTSSINYVCHCCTHNIYLYTYSKP